ncbi:MAG TPA: glycoside hydrolase family 16 protein [Polyangiaceae bacterium]
MLSNGSVFGTATMLFALAWSCSNSNSNSARAQRTGGDASSGTGGGEAAGVMGASGGGAVAGNATGAATGMGGNAGGGNGDANAGTAGSAGSPINGSAGAAGSGVAGGAGGSGGSGSTGGAGTAGSAFGGAVGSSGNSGGGQGGAGGDSFVLSWQDDFNTLDLSAWQLQTFTYDGNQAQFSTQNASVSNGVLTISLSAAPNGSAKPYLGVEMRSVKTLTYGKVSARMRFATGSGVVSGLVLFYTPFPNCDWNEIDIEHLGNSSNTSQLNAMVYTGTPNPNCTVSVTPTQDPLVTNLGFNAETGFHLYDVEWTPAGVKYFADGLLLRNWTANVARLKLPETILLTIWASSAASWAGPLTASSAPASADVDWIKVYSYSG